MQLVADLSQVLQEGAQLLHLLSTSTNYFKLAVLLVKGHDAEQNPLMLVKYGSHVVQFDVLLHEAQLAGHFAHVPLARIDLNGHVLRHKSESKELVAYVGMYPSEHSKFYSIEQTSQPRVQLVHVLLKKLGYVWKGQVLTHVLDFFELVLFVIKFSKFPIWQEAHLSDVFEHRQPLSQTTVTLAVSPMVA